MTSDITPEPERRRGEDRRRRDLPLWHPRRLHGRRAGLRREEEDSRPYFVDRVSAPVFTLLTLVLVLSVLDGLFTFALLEHGGFVEANPLMRLLLDRGAWLFFAGKYVLTVAFLPFAIVMHRYRLFGTKLRVGHLVPVVVALYVVLIAYQIGLWRGSNQAESARSSPAPTPARPSHGGRSAEAFSVRGGRFT
jgi:hypothetical protein